MYSIAEKFKSKNLFDDGDLVVLSCVKKKMPQRQMPKVLGKSIGVVQARIKWLEKHGYLSRGELGWSNYTLTEKGKKKLEENGL